MKRKFQERVLESVKQFIDSNVRKQRLDRIHECAMEILHLKDKTCTANSTLTDFKEDSEEMLALRLVDFKDVQNMSDNIQQLKKKNINSDLDKILGDVKSDQAELLVTLSKLSFLNQTRAHPDKSIAKKARDIRSQVQNVFLSSIESKYDVGTEISLLTTCEYEILRDLPIRSNDDTDFTQRIKGLFWNVLVNYLGRKSDVLHKHKDHFKLNKHFYNRMQKFAHCPLSVPVPKQVREKVKAFLDDIRFYKIDTTFKSRDGSTQ